MTLFKTDLLINNYLNAEQLNLITQQKVLIEPISDYFPNSTCFDIHTNLLRHGLVNPENSTRHIVEKWLDQDYLTIIKTHFTYNKNGQALISVSFSIQSMFVGKTFINSISMFLV